MEDKQRYYTFYNATDSKRWSRSDMSSEFEVTQHWLSRLNLLGPAVVLELGCGNGAMQNIHHHYVGLDFSLPALRDFASAAKRINGDMQCLPLVDNSIDFLFSWTALEHVPHPELTLREIERVLKPGGVALLAPAWHCRSWAAKGLPIRAYCELSWQERINKATIPMRNTLLYRSLFAIPLRLYREVRLRLGQLLPFDYRRLSPNLSEHIYTDCDAFTSMDPHAVIAYYLSRGWEVLSHPTFFRRFVSRHEPVVIRKPMQS